MKQNCIFLHFELFNPCKGNNELSELNSEIKFSY